MDTVELTLPVPEDLHELLIAELEELGFEGYVQDDDGLRAYVPAARWDDVARDAVEGWLARHRLDGIAAEQVITPANWNATWEATIEPLAVGCFLVKPSWAAVPEAAAGLIVLEIDPKMSFGTGYHESTRLVLRLLPGAVQPGDQVLDAGTGTGILAIAAVKLGAAAAFAFDIDPWAEENAGENVARNGVAGRVTVREGGMEVAPAGPFDLIVANIQRNVLVEMMPDFAARSAPGTRLVLAGLLAADRDAVVAAAAARGFALAGEARENAWWAGLWRYEPPA